MLSTAVALNLEGAPLSMQEDVANGGVAGAVLGGKGRFEPMISEPLGQEPVLAPPRPDSGAQREQVQPQGTPQAANDPSLGGSPNLA